MGSCRSCGGEGGVSGPCPECGALPRVLLVGVGEPASVEPTRVVSGRSRHRGGVVAVVALAAVLATSILVDALGAGGDATEQPDASDRPLPTTPSEAVTPAPARSVAPLGEPLEVDAVEGFGDHWLIAVNQSRGVVVQAPLGGGAAEVLFDVGAPGGASYSIPAQHLLVGDVLVGNGRAVRLGDGTVTSYQSDEVWVNPIGAMGPDTLLVTTRPTAPLLEIDFAGEVIAEHVVDEMTTMGAYPMAVRDRTLLVTSPHGVFAIGLDTGRSVRLLEGAGVAVGSQVLVGQRCPTWGACEVVVVALGDGAERGSWPQSIALSGPWYLPAGYVPAMSISPDDTRMAVVTPHQQVAVLDLLSGRILGAANLPAVEEEADTGLIIEVRLLWSRDSGALLVLPSFGRGGFAPDPVHSDFAVRVDRDATRVDRIDGILAVIRAVGGGTDLGMVLSDRPFEPAGDG
jgi:hypothetical protein